MAQTQQFCTFHLAGYFFGIEISKVQEVIRSQAVTPVPLADREIRGLINLRGQIITTIDLRRRMSLPDREAEDDATNVLVSTPDGAVSLEVDRIEDVLEIAEDTIESPPENIKESVRACISGVSKLEGRLLLILDEDIVLNLEPAAARAS